MGRLRHPRLERLRRLDFSDLMAEQFTGDPGTDWLLLRMLERQAQTAPKVWQRQLAEAKRKAWVAVPRGLMDEVN